MKCYLPLVFFVAISSVTACTKKEAPAPPVTQALFDSLPATTLLAPLLNEVSGIADSKTTPRHIWAEEDSGNPPQLYLISYDGTVRKKVYVKGAANHGWEDMCLTGTDLYIGDFGDNNAVRNECAIYIFPEPQANTDTVYTFKKIPYQYADGSHDADALLVDPATKDIYIITKTNDRSGIYKIAFPYADAELNTAVQVGTLSYPEVVGAALSPDATELLVKTYFALYHYKRNGQTIEKTLQSIPQKLPYLIEPQGEAVTFAADNSGFFTLSEKGSATFVTLNFYKRK